MAQAGKAVQEFDSLAGHHCITIKTVIEMEIKAIYFVAIVYNVENIFKPTIVEQFDDEADAREYAALMCKTKKHKYIVLKQLCAFSITQKYE